MPVELLMPRVAPSMQEGMIIKWLKNEGDPIKKDEVVVEISSEKASCEVESRTEGFIYKILAHPGDVIAVNKPLAIIRLQQDTAQDLEKIDTKKPNPHITVAGKTIEVLPPTVGQAEIGGRIKASPLAKQIAANEKVDLKSITGGSGPGGRIVKKDVLNFLASSDEAKRQHPSAAPMRPDKRIPISMMRRETNNRLRLSKDNVIPVTSVTEIDITELLQLYYAVKPVWKGVYDVNVTLNAFFIKAVALSLRKHEMLNATLEDNEIVVRGSVNVGLAMDHEEQLYVPVIKDADTLSVIQIAESIVRFVQKIKDKKLEINDMSNGTFTVTNVGPFDVQFSTPVIAYPQVGILGIGTVNERPAFQGDVIVKRSFCYLSLTYDHRVVNGVPAAGFRSTLKKLLEQPSALLN